MTEEEFENWLWDIFISVGGLDPEHAVEVKGNFDSFLTENRGLIVKVDDKEFQLTIVKGN